MGWCTLQQFQVVRTLVAVAFLGLSAPLPAAIQLIRWWPSGLSSPVFVGHAGDGTNRLFIVEQAGVIRVLQPGARADACSSTSTPRSSAGGERGLLGLAFHPQYATNGRFFVYYTRAGDGALVIAEYGVSGDPNVANTAETRAVDDRAPDKRQPQRRHAGVRARRISLYRRRRRRRRPTTRRTTRRTSSAARQDSAHRRRSS